jgi:8-oxo-dGTP diphosphatase
MYLIIMDNPEYVSGFLFVNDKILLLQRNLCNVTETQECLPGYFEVPGGKVGYDESYISALKREFVSETNLIVEVGAPFYSFYYNRDESTEREQTDTTEKMIERCYFVNLVTSLACIEFNEKYIRWYLVAEDELDNYQIPVQLKTAIKKAFEARKGKTYY